MTWRPILQSGLGALIRRMAQDQRATVSIIGAFTLTSLIGMAALSVELGRGYEVKIDRQGAADAAALAAANSYSNGQNDAVLTPTANDVARANGIPVSDVTVTRLTNFSPAVNDAVRVTIRTQVPLYFARLFSSAASYDVSVTATASLASSSAVPCILALAPATGVSLTGGTSISAPNCAVVSNANISVTGGSRITSKATQASGSTTVGGGSNITASTTVTYGTGITIEPGSGVSGTQVKKSNTMADPLAGSAALASAYAELGQVELPLIPSVPVGEDLSLGWYPTTMTFQGRTANLVNGTWTFPAGTYNIRNLNTSSLKLKILGPSTVTVSGSVNVGGGGGLDIGDGTVAIRAPISLSGGTTMTVGEGRHYFGQISVGGGSSATIGAGDLDVNGAILVDGGGSRVTIGAGNYAIGNNGSGTAINLSGGSYLKFGDGTFSADGSINTSGGSTLVFGVTQNHRINGNLSLNGNSTFGAGRYTINGNFTNNTGGTMSGTDVSFILAGSLNASGGTSLVLSAPTTASGGGIPDILFATRSTATTFLGGGSQNRYGGIIHAPNSDFSMTGGSSATGHCFSIIARTVTLASGPNAATACPSMASSSASSSSVTLVQ